MTEKLSKLEALKWTWIIWRDVAADSDLSKYDACARYGESFINTCPCCQYMRDNYTPLSGYDDMCNGDCLLKSVWGSSKPYACEALKKSPYRTYLYTLSNRIRTRAVQKIADGAWELYVKECKVQNMQPGNKFLMPTVAGC